MKRKYENILLVRIGWMKYYAGSQEGDEKPRSGGSYNRKHIGGEYKNFKDNKGLLFGSFSIPGENSGLKLWKINRDDDQTKKEIDNVLVVFFARNREDNELGQVVVGWYTNATVQNWYRKKGAKDYYIVSGKTNNAVLLPVTQRTWIVPRGENAPGRANIFYPTRSTKRINKMPWLKEILHRMENYEGPNLLKDKSVEIENSIKLSKENEDVIETGQGVITDPNIRRKIEMAAMNAAIKYFKKKRYDVEDVSKFRSYDLHCQKGSKTVLVEVKGTQAYLSSVLVTPKEVTLAQKNKSMALFVLHSIRVHKKKSVVKVGRGIHYIEEPWRAPKDKLSTVIWNYRIR